MELVIATHNLHKVREIRDMLKELKALDVLSLHNYPDYHLPEETGETFMDNASLKAEHGVHSARYAGEEATDAENRKKLLSELRGKEDLQRSAYFECCLVLAGPDGVKKKVSGTVEGMIAEEEAGRNGFGYDPIFIKNDYDKTFAQLEELTKNRISHRRKAFDKILPTLESLKG